MDPYGRQVPKHAHGTANLKAPTNSGKEIVNAVMEIFTRKVDPLLLIRRITIAVQHVVPEAKSEAEPVYEQLSLFAEEKAEQKEKDIAQREKERQLQEAMLSVRKKYGNNALLKGINYKEGATGRERNRQIGGHKA